MKTNLINLARQQVFEEYITKQQKEFDQWVRDADIAWKEKRVKLPYPAVKYPSEEEIYSRIEMLHKKLEKTVMENVVPTDLIAIPAEEDETELEDEIKLEVEIKKEVETKLPILLQKRKDIL
jgi:hypothetical protein